MSAELADLVNAVGAVLNGLEDGLKIPPDKIEKLATTLVKDLGVTDPSQLEGMGSEILTQVFADAFPKAPKAQTTIVRRWFKSHCDEEESVASFKSTKSAKPKKGKEKVELEGDSDDDLESLASFKIGAKSNRRELLAKRDQQVTGMTPRQNQAFAASLFCGYVAGEEEVEGIVYGTDIGTTDFARRLKKVDHVTFPKLLAKGEVEEVHDFLVNLMRAYSKEGMIIELTTLSQYVTMSDEMFDGDGSGKSKIRYHKAVGAKYPGRGLPMADGIDIALVVRILIKGGPSGSSSALADKVAAMAPGSHDCEERERHLGVQGRHRGAQGRDPRSQVARRRRRDGGWRATPWQGQQGRRRPQALRLLRHRRALCPRLPQEGGRRGRHCQGR